MGGNAEVKKIPSDEDFARAKKLMAESSQGLDTVCEQLNSKFGDTSWYHRVYILSQRDVKFRAYVFFKQEKDVVNCTSNGTAAAVEEAVYEKLEQFGRGKRGELTVAFEWDSNENVEKNYGGDYLLRLT